MAKPKRIRSPSYPAWPLDKAIQGVEKIYDAYRTSPIEREAAATLIGFSSLSGPAATALGAIRAYGLVALAGKGTSVVTERARTILFPDNDHERLSCLVEAAYSPPIFKKIRERFAEHDVPPEDGIMRFLHREELSQVGVKAAARSYIQTAQFILDEKQKVSDSSGVPLDEDAESQAAVGGSAGTEAIEVRVGDYVQWESQGVLQLPEPRRVRQVEEGGEWVLVEGSNTGIPMSEVSVVAQGEEIRTPHSTQLGRRSHRVQNVVGSGMKEDVFALTEGDVILQWPELLSRESLEDLKAWAEIVLRKIERKVAMNELINTPMHGAMPTQYSDDKEGRAAQLRDSKLDELE